MPGHHQQPGADQHVAPALSPDDIEKQVTFPVETALAGIPGLEYTRSLSRNGFSQVTAVFSDEARHLLRAPAGQRAPDRSARRACRPAPSRAWGRSRPGLGEIYMWTVEYRPAGEGAPDRGRAAGLADATALPDARGAAPRRPSSSAPPTCARCRTGSSARSSRPCRASPASTRSAAIVKQYHVQPDPAKLVGLGLSFGDVAEALEAQQRQPRRGLSSSTTARATWCARPGGSRTWTRSATSWSRTRGGVPVRVQDVAEVGIGARAAHRLAPARTARRSWSARR